MDPTNPSQNQQPPTPQVSSPPSSPTTAPMQPVAPNVPTAPIQSGGSKTGVWIAVGAGISILVLVVVAGFFVLNKTQNNSKKDAVSANSSKTTSTPSASTNKYANCLSKTDLTALQGDTYTLKDIDGVYHVYGSSVFFKPDSTNYEYADQVVEEFANYKKAFAGLTNKDWNIELQGQIKDVNGTGNSADNKKLANERAAKVRDEFVRAGVPTSRIKILEPEIYDVQQIKPGDSDRNVSIDIQSRCSDTQIEKEN